MRETSRGRKRDIQEPVERNETLRHYITAVLEEQTLSARDMAQFARIPEREVYEHLEHVRKSLHGKPKELVVFPARCESCGFEFRKRERLAKPGKCPQCRSALILPPLFRIE
jgi:predicted Zn-ribbon and HTH transcriptional regulator